MGHLLNLKTSSINQIFQLNNGNSKETLLIEGECLQTMKGDYENISDFRRDFEKEALGDLSKSKMNIPFAGITRLRHEKENTDTLVIETTGMDIPLFFSAAHDRDAVIAKIIAQKKFLSSEKRMDRRNAVFIPFLGLMATIFCGMIILGIADSIKKGERSIDPWKRKQLLFDRLAAILGVEGTIILFSLLAIACCYFIYKSLRKPPVEIVYS